MNENFKDILSNNRKLYDVYRDGEKQENLKKYINYYQKYNSIYEENRIKETKQERRKRIIDNVL